jgi:predicted AlkP superfamily pyrophosphatase or phosphodiesterase
MKWVALISLGLALVANCSANADEPPKPQLIVAIAVDQYSSDLFNEYRSLYSHGLATLTQGVVFPHGYQSHAATETCPGHSTILTGSHPSRTGIVANDWFDPNHERKTEKGETIHKIYCAEDPSASDVYGATVSAVSLKVPTLGDRLHVVHPDSLVVAVAGKDRAAMMMGGHTTDLSIWWNGKEYVSRKQPSTQAYSDVRLAQINDEAHRSAALHGTAELPPQCAARSRYFGLESKIGVPRPVSTLRRWLATPAFDWFTMKAAVSAVEDLKLGRHEHPDVLAISFSATDYVGHMFGPEGVEMCIQQLGLDRTIETLLRELDATGISYVVVLTADHGGSDVTERMHERGVESAARIDAKLMPEVVNAELKRKLGLQRDAILVAGNFFNDIYLTPAVPTARRAKAIQFAKEIYTRHPQVAAVFTKSELIAATAPHGAPDQWTLLDRAKASFDPQRSGDLIVLLKPYIIPFAPPDSYEGYAASHGSPWDYDRIVPIVFWWKGVAGFEQPAAVETVDILPTLADFIGLQVPSKEIDGRALTVVLPVH